MPFDNYGNRISTEKALVKSVINKLKNHKLKLNDKFISGDEYLWTNVFGEKRGWVNYSDHVDGIIYMIRNTKTGMIYIGQTENIFERKIKHLSDLKNFVHISTDMEMDFILYGEDTFILEIIEFQVPTDKLLEREKYWIKYFQSEFPNGYNMPYIERKDYHQRISKKFVEDLLEVKKKSKQSLKGKDVLKPFLEKLTSFYKWVNND